MQHLLPLIRAELDNPLRPVPEHNTPETTLAELGADALDMCVLSLAIEDHFGIDIHDHEFSAETTVGEIWALVRGKCEARERLA